MAELVVPMKEKNWHLSRPEDRQRWIQSTLGYEMLLESVILDAVLDELCGILQALLRSLDSHFIGYKKYPSYNSAFPLKPGTVDDSEIAELPSLKNSGAWRD